MSMKVHQQNIPHRLEQQWNQTMAKMTPQTMSLKPQNPSGWNFRKTLSFKYQQRLCPIQRNIFDPTKSKTKLTKALALKLSQNSPPQILEKAMPNSKKWIATKDSGRKYGPINSYMREKNEIDNQTYMKKPVET